MPITPQVLASYSRIQNAGRYVGQQGLLQQLTKALVERALEGEMTHHLGYPPHDAAGDNSGNSRTVNRKGHHRQARRRRD